MMRKSIKSSIASGTPHWPRQALCIALFFLAESASAQQVLGLSEIYRAALQNDATLSAAGAQVLGSIELVEQAKGQLKPNVSYNATYFRNVLDRSTEVTSTLTETSHELYNSSGQTIQLRQPLYRPALIAGLDVAQSQLVDANQSWAGEVQGLAMRAVDGYLELLNSKERQQLILVQQRFAERGLDAARKRFLGGQGIRTDIDEAQARVDLILAQQVEAEQAVLAARLALSEITQLPIGEVRLLDPTRVPMTPLPPLDVESWMSESIATSPVLASLQARVQAAQATVDRISAGHKPTLDAIAQVNKSNSENVTTPASSYINKQIGLQLVIPLYAGGTISSQVRQALAEQGRAEDLLEAERRAFKVRVHKEWRGMTDGARKVSALQLAADSADKVTVSVNKSFEGGLRTVLDVLDAEERAQTSHRDLLTARLQYVSSRLRLLSYAGKLDVERIDEASQWFTITDEQKALSLAPTKAEVKTASSPALSKPEIVTASNLILAKPELVKTSRPSPVETEVIAGSNLTLAKTEVVTASNLTVAEPEVVTDSSLTLAKPELMEAPSLTPAETVVVTGSSLTLAEPEVVTGSNMTSAKSELVKASSPTLAEPEVVAGTNLTLAEPEIVKF